MYQGAVLTCPTLVVVVFMSGHVYSGYSVFEVLIPPRFGVWGFVVWLGFQFFFHYLYPIFRLDVSEVVFDSEQVVYFLY